MINVGWIITRPGYSNEPKRVATWYMSPMRKDCIAQCVAPWSNPNQWAKLYKRGWRCERATILVKLETP